MNPEVCKQAPEEWGNSGMALEPAAHRIRLQNFTTMSMSLQAPAAGVRRPCGLRRLNAIGPNRIRSMCSVI
jgi:hypothetical protein